MPTRSFRCVSLAHRRVHSSFELEDMIEAVLEAVSDRDGAASVAEVDPWSGGSSTRPSCPGDEGRYRDADR